MTPLRAKLWVALLVFCLWPVSASAERISNPVALFAGLDKITGVTTNFEAKIGEQIAFGTFRVVTSVCFTRPVTEQPSTVAFVQIDEQPLSGEKKRIFSGWMFAESPGLNAVEHPVLDVWLTGCRDPNAPPPLVETPPAPETELVPDEEEQPLD
jgi:hypothetical protein